MRQEQMRLFGEDQEPKWFNSPVRFHKGSLEDIAQYVPDFDRQDFALGNRAEQPSLANARLDMIIRKPFGTEWASVPIGIVSKDYVLVQHTKVIETASKAMKSFGADPTDVQAEVVGGFAENNPTWNGFGEWIRDNSDHNSHDWTPRHD